LVQAGFFLPPFRLAFFLPPNTGDAVAIRELVVSLRRGTVFQEGGQLVLMMASVCPPLVAAAAVAVRFARCPPGPAVTMN